MRSYGYSDITGCYDRLYNQWELNNDKMQKAIASKNATARLITTRTNTIGYIGIWYYVRVNSTYMMSEKRVVPKHTMVYFRHIFKKKDNRTRLFI